MALGVTLSTLGVYALSWLFDRKAKQDSIFLVALLWSISFLGMPVYEIFLEDSREESLLVWIASALVHLLISWALVRKYKKSKKNTKFLVRAGYLILVTIAWLYAVFQSPGQSQAWFMVTVSFFLAASLVATLLTWEGRLFGGFGRKQLLILMYVISLAITVVAATTQNVVTELNELLLMIAAGTLSTLILILTEES